MIHLDFVIWILELFNIMSFRNIQGHDNIKLFFKRAIGLNKISHSYLFFGPDGVGKTLMAHTVAKALNCLDEADDSCGECPSCVKIENGNHPDVIRMELSEKKDAISIEQVRELQRQINLKPYEARTKVFIIQDSHLMSEAAANCLLKTLEEPPANSVVILVTSRPEELLSTVKSRCKHVKFEPLGLGLRVPLAEKKGFSKDEAVFLSRIENSGVFVSAESNEAGLFDYKNKVLSEFADGKSLLDEDSFLFGEPKDKMGFMLSILESWFRDVFILKAGGPKAVVVNSDRIDDLKVLIKRYSFKELEDILKEIENAKFCIERNVGSKLAFNRLKLKLREKGGAINEQ
jgi:DNA polymerase III subunit delta'